MASVQNSSMDQLLQQLKAATEQAEREKQRAEYLAEELRISREQNAAAQRYMEVEEEKITNKLMKRLEELKREKAMMAAEVEQEEEFLTNTLQKRLERLSKEKEEVQEEVSKLRKQLEQLSMQQTKLNNEKIDLENKLEAEQEYIMNKLQKQVDKLNSDKRSLQHEKSDLQRQVTDLSVAISQLARDKVNLENQMEMEEENIVNRLQRQLELLLHHCYTVEQKLEAKGLSLKELGIPPVDLTASEAVRIYSRSPSSTSSLDKFSSSFLLSTRSSGQLHVSPKASASSGRRERALSASSGSMQDVLHR